MRIQDFTKYLDQLLFASQYQDFCVNGLNVEASKKVNKVLTGVSLRESLIDKAIEIGADCIIVHHPHGFWDNESKILTGSLGRKVQKLMQHSISLYAFHLPLDGHPEIGNNAIIASKLGFEHIEGFFSAGKEVTVGCIAGLKEPIPVETFIAKVEQVFPYPIQHQLLFGKKEIQKIGICSGGGTSGIDEAYDLGVDLYFTGEIKEQTPIFIEEDARNLVACGHHRTEIFGVQALAQKIKADLNLPAVFWNIDNLV